MSVAVLLVTWVAPSAQATGIYWAHATTIGHANLDGTGVNQSFLSGANQPFDIAISLVPEPTTGLLLMLGVSGLRGESPP